MVAPRAETTPLSKENVNEDRAASTSSRNSVPIGPDGGYGWVIVGCSFICIFTIDGIITTYALLLPELNQSFQTTPALTSMGNSLILGIFLLMGMPTSCLINKYSCRLVAFIGSFIAACGFVASSMSSGIWTFLPTFGVIGGIGIGMVYLPSVLMVNSYFNQKRGIAQGIVTSGSGVGILVLAPLMEVLLENYGWRGAVLISAGLVLQLCVCSLLMRPLYIHTKSSVTRNVDKLPVASDNSLKLSTFDSDFKNKSYIEHYLKTSSNYNSTPTINTNNKHTLTQTNPKTPEQYLSMQCIKTAQYTVKTEREFKPLSKKDIFYSGSVQKLKEFDSHSTITEFEKRMTNRMYSSSDVSCKSDNIRSCSTEGLCDRSLLTNKAFLLLAAGAMLTQMGQYIPMVFLGDYALQIGLDRADVSIILAVFGFQIAALCIISSLFNTIAKFVAMGILCLWVYNGSDVIGGVLLGVVNTLARLLAGALTNIPKLTPLLICNIGTFICAIILFLFSFCTTFWTLCAFAVSLAVFVGFFPPMQPLMVLDYLGLDRLTSAFGLITFAKGPAAIFGPPIAGNLYQLSQSYSVSNAFAGGLFLLSVIIQSIIPFCNKSKTSFRLTDRELYIDELDCVNKIEVTDTASDIEG